MRHFYILTAGLSHGLEMVFTPRGTWGLETENLLCQQLFLVRQSRRRAPNLTLCMANY
ncbi:MAG: hypothetical protein JNK85_22625 [Verrucomicrobiales bacterium]|nr:hypothetical protein [Verrucomicrobiales bacterium]